MLVSVMVYVVASISFQFCYRISFFIYLAELFMSVCFQMNLYVREINTT